MQLANQNYWKKCSICKNQIAFSSKYYLCSVSTCKHPRKGFTFCSVDCWDAHLGYVNHRESWAEEGTAPRQSAEIESTQPARSAQTAPTQTAPTSIVSRKVVYSRPDTTVANVAPHATITPNDIKTDTLVVVSKVKDLIRNESEFNTSQCCIDALTKKVAKECFKAIEHARDAGRKTVMGRDVED